MLGAKQGEELAVNVTGALADGVTAKDLVLAIIGRLGTAGATGHTIEYRGEAIRAVDGRTHDFVQYEHRSWCSGRIGGGGRYHH